MLTRSLMLLPVFTLLIACGSPEDRVANYLDKAQALYEAGDLVGAQIEVQNAAQIQPKNAEARLLLAKLAMEKDQYIDALGHLQVAIETDPDSLDARVLLGFIYYYGRAIDELASQVEVANRLAPDDSRVLLMNARLLEANGDPEAALAKLDQSVLVDPSNGQAIGFRASLKAELYGPSAGIAALDEYLKTADQADIETLRLLRVWLLSKDGQSAQVEAELKLLMAEFPDNERYAETLSRVYVAEGRVEDAEQIFRDEVQRNQGDISRQIDLIQFLAGLRTAETAESALKQFIKDSPDSSELRLALGQLYDSEGRLEDAIVEYKRTSSMAPGSDEDYLARNRIASILARQGDPEASRAVVEQILADRPDDEEALLARATFNFAAGRYDEVTTDARLVVRKNSQSEAGLLLLARAHQASGNTLLAEDAFRSVLALNPLNVDAATTLGALLVAGGNAAEAELVLAPLMQVEEPAIDAIEIMAAARLAQGNLVGAEEAAQKIIDSRSDLGSGDFQFGRIAEARGDIDAAITFYQRSLEKNPASTAALQGLVSLSLTDNQADLAIDTLKQFVAANPTESGAQLLLGTVYQQTGARAQAEQVYRQLIADYPGVPQAYAALAEMLDENTSQRYEILRQGLLANPQDLRSGVLLGFEYERHGRIDEAIDAYDEAMRLNPKNTFVANNLAMLLLDHRHDDASLRRAMELASQFSRSQEAVELNTLGWAQYRVGNFPAAIGSLERAVALVGDVAVLRYHLGMAYHASGNLFQAKAELTKAVELAETPFTGYEEAKATLAVLEAS